MHSFHEREHTHRESSDDPNEETGYEIQLQLRNVVIEYRKAAGRHFAADPECFDRDTALAGVNTVVLLMIRARGFSFLNFGSVFSNWLAKYGMRRALRRATATAHAKFELRYPEIRRRQATASSLVRFNTKHP